MKKLDIIDAAIMLVREKWQAAKTEAPDLSWECELHKTEQTLHTLYYEYGGGKHPTNPTYTGPDRHILEKEKAKMKIETTQCDPEVAKEDEYISHVRMVDITLSEGQRELAALGLLIIRGLIGNEYTHLQGSSMQMLFSLIRGHLQTRTLKPRDLLGADIEKLEARAKLLEHAMRTYGQTRTLLNQKNEKANAELSNSAEFGSSYSHAPGKREHNADLYPNAYPKSLVD